MPLRPQDVAEMVMELVSLPQICIRLNEMIDGPDCAIADIGELLSQDPALCVNLLKLANSPFYGFQAPVESVTRAVTAIGIQGLRDLVLATYAVETFSKLPNSLADTATFWRHSIYCGIVARLLSAECRMVHKERLFLSGMLHDIGKMAMYGTIPELVEVIFARFQVWEGPLYEAEHSILGFHHGEVGAELMRLWHLPVALIEVARYHHEPANAANFSLETAIVHVANNVAHMAGFGDTHMEEVYRFDPAAWSITGLSDEVVKDVIPIANSQFEAVLASLMPRMRTNTAA